MGWDTQVGILIEEIKNEKDEILTLFMANPPLIYSTIQMLIINQCFTIMVGKRFLPVPFKLLDVVPFTNKV